MYICSFNVQQSLDFKIDMKPKKLDSHIKPDNDITVDKYDQVYNQQEEAEIKDLIIQEYDLRQAVNPLICIGSLLSALTPILIYLFAPWNLLIYEEVSVAQLLNILFIKNYIGQKLIGLKWGLEFRIDGSEKWNYQIQDNAGKVSSVDSTFFWTSSFISFFPWGLLTLKNILSLSVFWICANFLCLILGGINLYGFYRCRGEYKRKLQLWQKEMAKQGLNIVGMIMK
ncbi:vesicle-mediated transport [Paramecium bursaria]